MTIVLLFPTSFSCVVFVCECERVCVYVCMSVCMSFEESFQAQPKLGAVRCFCFCLFCLLLGFLFLVLSLDCLLNMAKLK